MSLDKLAWHNIMHMDVFGITGVLSILLQNMLTITLLFEIQSVSVIVLFLINLGKLSCSTLK